MQKQKWQWTTRYAQVQNSSVQKCINKSNCKTSSDMVKQFKTEVTSIQNTQCMQQCAQARTNSSMHMKPKAEQLIYGDVVNDYTTASIGFKIKETIPDFT
jgi:hypothetical protein